MGRQGDILLLDVAKKVSRMHASIEWRDGDWLLSDMGSHNGTFVNGATVQRHFLKAGDVLRFGDYSFKVVMDGEAADAANGVTYAETEKWVPPPRETTGLVGRSAALKNAMALASRAAKSDVPVIVYGESGTGKELFARLVFEESNRRTKKFLVANCSAIEQNLIGSTLFGYEEGAFTGADRLKKGLFEEADGGTLYVCRRRAATALLLGAAMCVAAEEGLAPMSGAGGVFRDAERRALTPAPVREPSAVPKALPPPKANAESADPAARRVIGPISKIRIHGSTAFAERERVAEGILAALGDGDKTVGDVADAIAGVKKALLKKGFYLVRITVARVRTYDRATGELALVVDEGRFGELTLTFAGEEEGTWFSREQILRRFEGVAEGDTFDYGKLEQLRAELPLRVPQRGRSRLPLHRQRLPPLLLRRTARRGGAHRARDGNAAQAERAASGTRWRAREVPAVGWPCNRREGGRCRSRHLQRRGRQGASGQRLD